MVVLEAFVHRNLWEQPIIPWFCCCLLLSLFISLFPPIHLGGNRLSVPIMCSYSASAFVPNALPAGRAVSRSNTLLMASLDNLVGASAPFGPFDPLGLAAKASPEQLNRYRESELKHGRVSTGYTDRYCIDLLPLSTKVQQQFKKQTPHSFHTLHVADGLV